jgi:hypothetical protein
MGGHHNHICSNSNDSIISGGRENSIYCSQKSDIIGGEGLTLTGEENMVLVPKLRVSTVYQDNSLNKVLVVDNNGNVKYRSSSSLGGGASLYGCNNTLSNSHNSNVLGGCSNSINKGYQSSILGGQYNSLYTVSKVRLLLVVEITPFYYCADYSSILGGGSNTLNYAGCYTSIIGGCRNCIRSYSFHLLSYVRCL